MPDLVSKNIDLIIHGPIYFKGFDCNELINAQLENYGKNFNKIIITTWIDQKKYISEKLLSKNIFIKYLEDPKSPRFYNDFKPKDDDSKLADNTYRSFYAVYEGIKEAESEFVIKIRTDLKIDLNKVINHFKKEIERKDQNIICASSFIIYLPFVLGDMCYIGKKKLIHNFFLAQMIYKRFKFNFLNTGSPESETVKRYLFFRRKYIKNFKNIDFFPLMKKNVVDESTIINRKTLKLWQYGIRNYFTIFTDEIRNSMSLRGISINDKNGIARNDTDYKIWLNCEIDFIKALKLHIKKKKSFSTIISLPNLFGISYSKIYEFKNRKKSLKILLFQRQIYIIVNYFLNILNKIYRKIIF